MNDCLIAYEEGLLFILLMMYDTITITISITMTVLELLLGEPIGFTPAGET